MRHPEEGFTNGILLPGKRETPRMPWPFSGGVQTGRSISTVFAVLPDGSCPFVIGYPWEAKWYQKAIPVFVYRGADPSTLDKEASEQRTQDAEARHKEWLEGPEPARIERAIAELLERGSRGIQQEAA